MLDRDYFHPVFAMPSSRQVLGAESGKLMGGFKEFTPAANFSIILLVITVCIGGIE